MTNNSQDFIDQGVALSNIGREEEAIICFDKALAVEPNNYKAMRARGISLSHLGREEEAIIWFDRALTVKPDDYNSMRARGISLSHLGREEEAIIWFDRALTVKPDDYNSMRARGISLSYLNREEEAIIWFDKALAVKPDDYESMRARGISLVCLGRKEEGITWFDKALAVKPDDYKTMRSRGICLSRLNHEEEAITWFDKALTVNPDDYNSMCVRGISLSCLGREEEAITWYSKGLEVKPDDLRLLRLRSEAFARLKNADKAREDLKRIEEFYPNDKLNQIHASRVLKLLGLQKESQQTLAKADLARGNEDSYDDYLRDLTRLVLEEFKPEKEIFFRQKLEAEEAFQDFLNLGDPSTRLQPFHESRIFFMGLRKWNSFTPSLPSAGEDSVGGGYFLFYKGTGTVIDPGFNFLRNFYKAGGRLNHIHNVVITHAHNDHTNDLEIILSHLHQRNEKLKRLKKGSNGTKWQNDDHRVDLYLNLGAFIKYSGYLDLRTEYVRDIRVINTGEEYSLAEGLRLRVLPAYHDEVVSQKYSVGLHFSLDLGKEIKKHVVFTGDSGLCKTEPGDGGEAMVGLEEVIWKKYFPGTEPPPIDLLVVHLGSIKPNELDEEKLDRLADALDQKIGRIRKDDSPFYHNHLGIHGVVTLITNLKPKLALISEFGEELKSFLPSLMKIIATCVEQLTLIPDGTPKPVVAPCALFLLYDLETDKICSVISKKFEPIKTIKYKWVDKGSTGPEGPLIFFNPNDSGDTDRWLGGIEWLMESMKTGKGIFAEPQ